ncbi:GDSL-type esterase/lipase family protein [Pelosinus propionicus]|uniref:Lysophospholipase L1 n=1 Tax=Pelosinus propionicus DSM 13327 TaxID=1123291 RepID=A0A1I4PCA9_9FIRM|nr:GDSL-type esterase/lipase family protein [Pelosinus propionicus]SFM25438.1 Lysophospholipase L1 [Pelosinus propionicus DSM 13327]
MKRLLFLIVILTILLFFIENSDQIGLLNYKPTVEITNEEDNYTLIWSPISYFTYYEVEIVNQIPEKAQDSSNKVPRHLIIKYRTFENSITIRQNFPESAYLRVSAHSLFHHPLGSYSDFIPITKTGTGQEAVQNRPRSLIHYPIHAPASNFPLLMWTPLQGAVYYEIEFLSAPPENPNDIFLSRYQIFASREVFTNGYSINLSTFPNDHIFWRVRALDYAGNPLGVFSDVFEIHIDHSLSTNLKPVSNTGYKAANMPVPLYPVFSWIPITGATSYEIELTSAPPENPNGTQPSRHRLRQQIVTMGSDYYDETPLVTPGTYYWRVRGLDESGMAVGVYSNAESFIVDRSPGKYAATLGDSITHGGGAVSYSPADIEYSFQNYLSFPTINLGKSGDTSASMLSRFDADVLPYHPMFLIIMGGTNSLRGGVPGSQVVKELSAIRDKCLVHGIRPIFLTLPPINPQAIQQVFNEETVPEWQKEFAVVNHFIRQQRYYIDLEPYFADENQTLPLRYATDGLHLDIEGKKLMAQIINANWAAVTQ